jgi:hypothetical protein
MASERQYYFILKNKDIKDTFLQSVTTDKEKGPWGLPLEDSDAIYENGFLIKGITSDDFKEELNQKVKYRQSVYYKNEVIKDLVVGDEPLEGSFEILEPGYYKIELTASGTRCKQSKNFLTNFLDINNTYTDQTRWKNTLNNDILEFTPEFKWTLKNNNDQLLNNGYYKVTNQSLILFTGKFFNFDDDVKGRIDSDNNLYAYTTLFFEYSDRYHPFFRKLILFENNSSFYKEFIIDNVTNTTIKEGYYPEFSKKINYGDITHDFNEKFTIDNEILTNSNYFPYWNYTYDLKPLIIENNPVGGNSGKVFDIIELSENYYSVKYYISSPQSEETIGSFVVIINSSQNLIYSCFVQTGKFYNLSNIPDSNFNKNYINLNPNGKTFLQENKNSVNFSDSNLEIGIKKIDNSDGKIKINNIDLNKFNGIGLGSESQGIKKDFNNFNYYSEADPGFLKFTFLSPIYTTVVDLSLNIDSNNNDIIGISGVEKTTVPLDTFIEYKFNLDETKQIDLEQTIVKLNDIEYSLLYLLNNNNFKNLFKIKRISNLIQVLTFYVFENIEIKLKTCNRKYSINFIKDNKLLNKDEIEQINFESNIGLNRFLFYIVDQNFNSTNILQIQRNNIKDKIIGNIFADYFIIYKENTLYLNSISYGSFISLDIIKILDGKEESSDNELYFYNKEERFKSLYSENFDEIRKNLLEKEGRFELINEIAFSKNKFFEINNYEFYLSSGQLLFLINKFNTFKIKISSDLSVFNTSYFLSTEGMDTFKGRYDFNSFFQQNLFIIANSNINFILNLTKRLYSITISQENREKLNWLLIKDNFYPFELITINFTFSSFYKFDILKCFAFINFDNNYNRDNFYNLIDFFDDDVYDINDEDEQSAITNNFNIEKLDGLSKILDKNNQIKYKQLIQILYNFTFLYERLYQDENLKQSHGYFRNLPERIKSLLSEEEKIELNLFMKFNNLSLEFDVSYTDLSTIIEMGEREFKNVKINQDGYYRIFLAGGQSGNGGNGGDAGISTIKPEDSESGRDDIYSSTVLASTASIYRDGYTFVLKITVSKSIMPVLYELNELNLTRLVNTEETKKAKAEEVFRNIAREDELAYSFLHATINGNSIESSLNHKNFVIEYDVNNCLIYIKNISFNEELTSSDSFIINNLNIVLIESYMNTSSTINGGTSLAKNTYTFYPPRNFRFFNSYTGAEIIDSQTKAFINNWNKFWFNIDSDQNINVFNKNIYTSDKKNDYRAQRILYNNSNNLQYQYYLSNPANWPDIYKSQKIEFPRADKAISLNTRVYINSSTSGGGHFSSAISSIISLFGTTATVVPKMPPPRYGGTRPAALIPPFLSYPSLNSSTISFGQTTYLDGTTGNMSGGCLMNDAAGRTAPTEVYNSPDYAGANYSYFCYDPELQKRCCVLGIRTYKTTEKQGTKTVTVERQRYEIVTDGLIMVFTPGLAYLRNINGTLPRTWNLKLTDIKYRKAAGFGTQVLEKTDYMPEIIIKYGNGGGAGRGGDSFLQKSLSGTPGTASAMGSWPDWDFTAKNLSYQPKVGTYGELYYNELNGLQGLLGIESFCFGIENAELRENPVSDQIIQHHTLEDKIIQSQDKTLWFRGALIDNIFYLKKGNIIIETGGKGGDGEHAFNAGIGEYGFSGGGGGAGAPSILFIYNDFYIYKSYYEKFNISNLNFIDFYKDTTEIQYLIEQRPKFLNNFLFIAAGGRAGDMFITRNPYVFYTISNFSAIAPEFLNKPEENTQALDIKFGSSSSSSSSEVIMNEYYQFNDEVQKQFMGWEFNGLPGGNGGSGYIGGNGGNGGHGMTGVPDTYTKGSPVLQKNFFIGLGDYYKIVHNFQDLFSSSSSSSHTINIYNNYHNVPFTEHYESNYNKSTRMNLVFSTYIGRGRMVPTDRIMKTLDYFLQDLYLHSFYIYDPSIFLYKLSNPQRPRNENGRSIVLKGSRISSFEYYKILKNHLMDPNNNSIFALYDYTEINEALRKNLLQVPGFGGGWNTFYYKNKNDNEPKLYATFEQIELPRENLTKGEIIWEKLPAGGKPAEITLNTLNILEKTNFEKILVYNEYCKYSLDVQLSQKIKQYNLLIKNKTVPLEGAGCKIIYLCSDTSSKNLDTGNPVIDIY